MLPLIGIAALVLIAVLLVAAAKPGMFRVQRAVRIDASAERLFAVINDFHGWGSWSPYERLDPFMRRTFSEPARGRGAVYAWESRGKLGVGRMQIVESSAPSRVVIRLDFAKPFTSRNIVEFTLSSADGVTQVTWSMRGRRSYLGRFLNMDRLMGKDFERGLASLKAIAEVRRERTLALAA